MLMVLGSAGVTYHLPIYRLSYAIITECMDHIFLVVAEPDIAPALSAGAKDRIVAVGAPATPPTRFGTGVTVHVSPSVNLN